MVLTPPPPPPRALLAGRLGRLGGQGGQRGNRAALARKSPTKKGSNWGAGAEKAPEVRYEAPSDCKAKWIKKHYIVTKAMKVMF